MEKTRISTDGLIIKEQNIGEQDRLVTVLTRDIGVVRCFVRGAKSLKSSKNASTGLMCYSKLTIAVKNGKYIIEDARLLDMFFDLRKDITKVSLAQYFCELSSYICPEGQSSDKQLSLILNAMFLLTKGEKPQLLIKACVELRLCAISGYMPDLVMCRECGAYEKDEMFFLIADTRVVCSDCQRKHSFPSALSIDKAILHAMRHITYIDDKKVFAFTLSDKSLEKLSYITESYICRSLERDFKTLHFYKTISS